MVGASSIFRGQPRLSHARGGPQGDQSTPIGKESFQGIEVPVTANEAGAGDVQRGNKIHRTRLVFERWRHEESTWTIHELHRDFETAFIGRKGQNGGDL